MATEIYTKKAAEILVAGCDFSSRLVDGDGLTGTPTAAVQPAGLTLGTPAKNAAPVTILLATVATNKAVLVSVSGGTPGVTYTVTLEVDTVSGQHLAEDLFVKVRS
ncbi:MAG: hypothetical protein AB7G51_08455 [Steroidobacteraceae bacterium]